MNASEFEKVVEARFECCRRVLLDKAREYASEQDRLSNFQRAADLRRTTPQDALAGMVAKHIIALFDFIQMQKSKIDVSDAMWDEKILDIINYMLLLEALNIDSGDMVKPVVITEE